MMDSTHANQIDSKLTKPPTTSKNTSKKSCNNKVAISHSSNESKLTSGFLENNQVNSSSLTGTHSKSNATNSTNIIQEEDETLIDSQEQLTCQMIERQHEIVEIPNDQHANSAVAVKEEDPDTFYDYIFQQIGNRQTDNTSINLKYDTESLAQLRTSDNTSTVIINNNDTVFTIPFSHPPQHHKKAVHSINNHVIYEPLYNKKTTPLDSSSTGVDVCYVFV